MRHQIVARRIVVTMVVLGLGLCTGCSHALSTSSGSTTRSDADAKARAALKAFANQVEYGAEAGFENALESLERKRCPEIGQITSAANIATKTLADLVGQLADRTAVSLAKSGKDHDAAEAVEELTRRLRNAALDAQKNLLKKALERECDRRKELLEAERRRFRTKAILGIRSFEIAVGLPPRTSFLFTTKTTGVLPPGTTTRSTPPLPPSGATATRQLLPPPFVPGSPLPVTPGR